MFGSKSRTRQAELAAAEADKAAQVAAEKALAAEAAQEAARAEIRERKRAEREQALSEARGRAADLWSDAQSRAADVKDKAQSKASDAKSRVQDETSDTRSRTSKIFSRAGDKTSDVTSSGRADLAGLIGSVRGSKGNASDLADSAGNRLSDVMGRASEVADRARGAYQSSDGVQNARDNALNAAATARQWALPHVEAARDRGLGLAAPHVENAAASLQPRVDAVHSKVVDELLPKVRETVASATAATGTQADAVAETSKSELNQVAGRAKRRSKAAKSTPSHREIVKAQKADNRGGGRVVLLLGALGAGGVAAFAAWKSSQSSQDPWAVATASTQPAGTSNTTTTTAATPQYDSPVTTPGPMMAEGAVAPAQDFGTPQAAPRSGGFGVDSDVSEGTVDDVRPEVVSAPTDDLPVHTDMGQQDTEVGIHRDLLNTDLPQRAPVQAREPFGQESQPVSDPQFYSENEQVTENVHLDDDALQQYRRNRDILPGHEDNN